MQRTEVLIKGKLGVIASTPRIVLPSDLSTSLQYLDGAGLERLLAAANAEMDRRKGTEGGCGDAARKCKSHSSVVQRGDEGTANCSDVRCTAVRGEAHYPFDGEAADIPRWVSS